MLLFPTLRKSLYFYSVNTRYETMNKLILLITLFLTMSSAVALSAEIVGEHEEDIENGAIAFRFTDRVYSYGAESTKPDIFSYLALTSHIGIQLEQLGYLHAPDDVTHIIIDYDFHPRYSRQPPNKEISDIQYLVVIRAYRDGADKDARNEEQDIVYFEQYVPGQNYSSDTRWRLLNEIAQKFSSKVKQNFEEKGTNQDKAATGRTEVAALN